MSAKEDILANLRSSLSRSQRGEAEKPHRDYILTGDNPPGSEPVIKEFVDALLDYKAQVHVVTSAELPAAISQALHGRHRVVVPAGLQPEWKKAAKDEGREVVTDTPEAPLSHAELDHSDAVVTAARVCVSGTGTIILDGAPDQGRRALTLVPDAHVCVVDAAQVMPTTPQAVAVLNEHPTRPITWIAGPSATSDIELIRVDGVHGPRNLTVLIVQ